MGYITLVLLLRKLRFRESATTHLNGHATIFVSNGHEVFKAGSFSEPAGEYGRLRVEVRAHARGDPVVRVVPSHPQALQHIVIVTRIV